MFGQNQNDHKDNLEEPFGALRGFHDYGDYATPFSNEDVFKSMPDENSLDPIAWRSTSEGLGGGQFEGGWGALGTTHHDDRASMNPKFEMPQLGPGRKQLYHDDQHTQHHTAKTMSVSMAHDVVPPAAPGGYLEPHSHFLSASACVSLFQAVQAWLDEFNIDFVVKPAKFLCKCVAYRNQQRIPFNVRLFQTNNYNTTAVEFNRRAGDAIEFGTLYRNAKAALGEAGHVLHYTPTKMSTQAELPPLPPLDDSSAEASSLGGVGGAVESLVAMAASPFVDVQEQGLAALADMTTHSTASCVAFPGQALDVLVDSLKSDSRDINRCAITCLANVVLVGQMEMCQRLAEQRVVSTLLALTAADCVQVVRESARALHNMATILKAPMVEYEPLLRTQLPVLGRSADVMVRGYAAALQRIVV